MAENETPSQDLGGEGRVVSSIRGHQKSWIMMIGTLNFNIFTFLKVVCSVCFLQKETKKSKKTQKSEFLCPKRFLAFSVRCVFCKIKKLKNVV